MVEQAVLKLHLQPLLRLFRTPEPCIGEVERPREVPVALAAALDVFEKPLEEVVAEELVERERRRRRRAFDVQGPADDAVVARYEGGDPVPVLRM